MVKSVSVHAMPAYFFKPFCRSDINQLPMTQRNLPIAKNVFGEPLVPCSFNPLTGFFRDGCCKTNEEDIGRNDGGFSDVRQRLRQRSVYAAAGMGISRFEARRSMVSVRPSLGGSVARRRATECSTGKHQPGCTADCQSGRPAQACACDIRRIASCRNLRRHRSYQRRFARLISSARPGKSA
jgi:hypothetical protein